MILDRVKASLLALTGASDPRAAYGGLFRGTVLRQSGDVVDLKMDDAAIPGVSSVAIQVGLPGSKVTFAPGCRMLFAFENRDPAKPIALTWDAATGATVIELTLGAHEAIEAVIRGTSYRAAENALWEALDIGFDAMQIVAVGPLVSLKGPIATIQAGIKAYRLAGQLSGDFLSTIVRVA